MEHKVAESIQNPVSFYPLDEFYARHGYPLPPIEIVQGHELPQPYRRLLDHAQDMTSTLENFHGDKIHLKLLKKRLSEDCFFREVALILNNSGKVVEFGAIRIYLNRFAETPRQLIMEGRLPLGRIIQDHGVKFSSHPKAFLKVESDLFINGIFGLKNSTVLYGRQNRLIDPGNHPLAEIVEILPPIDQGGVYGQD